MTSNRTEATLTLIERINRNAARSGQARQTLLEGAILAARAAPDRLDSSLLLQAHDRVSEVAATASAPAVALAHLVTETRTPAAEPPAPPEPEPDPCPDPLCTLPEGHLAAHTDADGLAFGPCPTAGCVLAVGHPDRCRDAFQRRVS